MPHADYKLVTATVAGCQPFGALVVGTGAVSLHGCAQLIAGLSMQMVLEPGDLLCAGARSRTPPAPVLQSGDVIEGTITGRWVAFGTQQNRCVSGAGRAHTEIHTAN